MSTHRISTQVQPDGTIVVHNLPFAPGADVEVVISSPQMPGTSQDWAALRGTVLKYDKPCEPVIESSDWDASQ